jgi:MFS transporter, PPP family, 3-phenylpropionic acid transporter
VIRLRLSYLFFFIAMASSMPYYALIYQERGLTGSQIGILVALPPLMTMVGAPLWTALADATHRHKAVLLFTTGGAFFGMLGIMVTQTFSGLLPVVVFYALCMAPLMSMIDNIVMAKLGERKESFGRQRIVGSAGPAVAGPLLSALVGCFGLRVPFYSTMLSFALLFFLFQGMTIRVERLTSSFVGELRTLLRNSRLRQFLLVVFLGMTGYSAMMVYLFVRLEELGAPTWVLGFGLTLGTAGEIPFLLSSKRLLQRFGVRATLLASLIAIVVVLFGVSLAPTVWLVLLLQLLHGTAFSGMIISGVAYADAVAPPGLGATAQGLFNAVFGGLASAAGAFLSSVMRDQWGSVRMFQLSGSVALLGLVVFVVSGGLLERGLRDPQAVHPGAPVDERVPITLEEV